MSCAFSECSNCGWIENRIVHTCEKCESTRIYHHIDHAELIEGDYESDSDDYSENSNGDTEFSGPSRDM
jgi:hypothetical protein